MALTEEQLKKAARKAHAAGDLKSAQELFEQAQLVKGIGADTQPEAPPKSDHISTTRGRDGMTTAERIAAAKAGTLKDPRTPDQIGRQAGIDYAGESDMKQGAFGAFAGNLAQGLTFGFADELASTNDPIMRERLREKRARDEANYPIATTAGDVTGAVAGSAVGLGLAAPRALAMAPASALGQVITGTGAGIVIGGTEGALSGAGYADGQDIGREAIKGGVAGAAMGGAVGALAPLVAKGGKAVLEWAKGYDAKVISRVLGIDRKSAEMLKASMAADDPAKALAAIKGAGDDAMLADAGAGPSNLLDTAMQSSGGAARIAGDRIEARAANAGKRITKVFDNLLGKAEDGMKTAAKNIAKATSDVRKKAYDRAFATPIDYAGDAGRAIDDVISRVPKDKLSAAVKSANDAMQIEGRVNKQIMATIAPDGSVAFSQPMDAFQLNELKVALGTQKRAAVDQFGRPTREGVLLGKLETDLRDAISGAVPGYKAALRLGADKIAEDEGLALGRKMLLSTTTREEVADFLKGAPKAAVEAVKRGVRLNIDEAMNNVRTVISDPNGDAREAIKALGDMSSKAAKTKMTAVLGPARADALFESMDEARAHLELRARVATNTKTAARTAIQDEAKRIVGDTFLDAVRDGRPFEATTRVMKALTGGSEARKAEELKALYTTVADVLTKTRGKDAEEAMKIVTAALQGQKIKTEDAAKVARLIAGSAAIGGYQAGKPAADGLVDRFAGRDAYGRPLPKPEY
jgi:hypothetical protein